MPDVTGGRGVNKKHGSNVGPRFLFAPPGTPGFLTPRAPYQPPSPSSIAKPIICKKISKKVDLCRHQFYLI